MTMLSEIHTRFNILDLFPPGPVMAVEVGTDTGINARELLKQRPDLFLWTVDPYLHYPGYEEVHDPGRKSAMAWCEKRIGEFRKTGRTRHVRLPSVEAAKHFSGRLEFGGEKRCMSFDYIYIDGDHREAGVREDLEAWWPLLLSGGIMAGHDFDDPGVSTPVIAFAKKHRLSLEVLNEHGGPDFDIPGSGRDGWGAPCHPSWVMRKLPSHDVAYGNK